MYLILNDILIVIHFKYYEVDRIKIYFILIYLLLKNGYIYLSKIHSPYTI